MLDGAKSCWNYVNVFDKRVANTSEWRIFNYPTTTILNCCTTTLRTNYNYITTATQREAIDASENYYYSNLCKIDLLFVF